MNMANMAAMNMIYMIKMNMNMRKRKRKRKRKNNMKTSKITSLEKQMMMMVIYPIHPSSLYIKRNQFNTIFTSKQQKQQKNHQ